LFSAMSSRLWEQVRDWVLLAALLLVSLYVMFTQNDPLMRAVRAQALSTTASVERTFAWVGRYFRALEENDELRRQNIALSSEVARSRESRIQNTHLRRMLNLRDSLGYPMRAARVVAKDITQQHNLLTLDVGTADSVKVGMPVVNEDGIIGKVVLVNDHFARVMPYLNTDFRVPAKVVPIEAEGIVRWEGQNSDRLLMEHVIKTEPVEPGQLVVTSGHSGVFPPGRAIGRVDSVMQQPGQNELRMHLTPAAPINEVDHAFVILLEPPTAQVALESEPIR
jgi:rod shape-determining protein MreC